MPSQTAGGLPYPLPTEPVRDGAVAIQNLATALEARRLGLEYQSGRGGYTPNAAGLFNLNWPHAFAAGAAPVVFFNCKSLAGAGFIPYAWCESSPDEGGVVVHVQELNANLPWTSGVDVHWLAIGPKA